MKQRRLFRSPIALLILLFSCLLSPVSTLSQNGPQAAPWSDPLVLSRTAGRSTFPGIVSVGPAGDLLVLWVDYATDPRGEVLARHRMGSTGAWTATVNLSASDLTDDGAFIYADAQGRVHVAWTHRGTQQGSDILYRSWENGSWSASQSLDHTSTYMPFPYGLHFVEDVSGTLWLFVTAGSGVTHTVLRDGVWEPLVPWVYIPGVQVLADVVSGPDGLFHVAVLGENQDAPSGCDPWLYDAYYTTTDGTTWAPLTNLTYLGTIVYDVDLAFDADGALHFFWSDNHPRCSVDSEKSAIYRRVLQGGGWSSREEVTNPNKGQALLDLAVAVDPSGRLHVVWSEGLFDAAGLATELAIRYRWWAGGDSGEEEIVWSSSDDSINVDLAMYRGMIPVAVWEEGSSSNEEVAFGQRWGGWQVFLPLVGGR